MQRLSKLRPFVERLVDLSSEGGTIRPDQVEQVLATLRQNPPRHHRQILRLYARAVERRQRENTLRVESAIEPSAATLESLRRRYSDRHQRSLTPEVVISPELIAGLRIRVGDHVYEDSVTSRLQQLKNL